MMLSSILFLVMDKLDREPGALLLALFFRGALAMVPILVLEVVADQFIDFFPWRPIVYLFLAYFVVPGFIEEGVKYRVLLRRTWNEPHFNHRFDGVVYGVFVSLGFAAVENVLYVLTSGGGAGHFLHPGPRHVRRGHGGGDEPGKMAGGPRTAGTGRGGPAAGLASAGGSPRSV